MIRLAHKGKRFLRYWQLFDKPSEMVKYYRCRHWPYFTQEVELQPSAIPHAVLCRPRTSDAAALWGAFGEKFHRPPSHLESDAVILDLGANVGYTAVDFANLYPTSRIVAVEMDGDNAEYARRNLERFGSRCTVIHAAAWIHEGIVQYDGQEEWAYQITAPVSSNSEGRAAPAITIPALMDSLGLERIDFAKVDIEGAEASLLSDSATWLGQVGMLKVEVHPPASMSHCSEVLKRWGFNVSEGGRHGAILVATRS